MILLIGAPILLYFLMFVRFKVSELTGSKAIDFTLKSFRSVHDLADHFFFR